MAGALARPAFQHGHRTALVDEGQQALAGPVPVDQEDDARADAFQLRGQPGLVVGLEAGRAHQVSLAGIETLALPALGLRPLRAHLGELALEEGETLAVQVGVGQRGDRRGAGCVDLDDQHMGVVGADVVLDHQARAVAGGGGVQAGVLALERARQRQAAHEGGHPRAVAAVLGQLPCVGAVDLLGGQRRREMVQGLVQVHHGEVKAVALATLAVGQCGQGGRGQHRTLEPRQLGLPVADTLGQAGIGRAAFKQRAGHRGQVLREAGGEAVQVGQDQGLVLQRGQGRQLVQPLGAVLRADAGSHDLLRQVQCHIARMTGVGGGGLQHGEVELEAVVGFQRGTHAGRLQQRRQAQGGNGPVFFHEMRSGVGFCGAVLTATVTAW